MVHRLRQLTLLSSIVGALVVSGCQSQQEAMEVFCDAPSHCDRCRNASPEDRMQLMSMYLDENLSNGEPRALFDSLGALGPEARSAAVRAAMAQAGRTECAILDVFEAGSTADP